MKESWKEMLTELVEAKKDRIVDWTFKDGEELVKFDTGYGGTEGCAFTAWGEKYVYFPVCYDGSEWVGYAPRNPCEEKIRHWGGG